MFAILLIKIRCWLTDAIKVAHVEHLRVQYERYITNGNVIVGEHSYGLPYVIIDKHAKSRVIIGKYCSIASGAIIHTGGNHNTRWISTYPHRIMFDMQGKYADGHPSSKGDVRIGHDVWIGQNVAIVSGVNIGNGAVIAACSVVTKDIPPYTLAGGNPARPLRRRFSESNIDALQKIQWWNWPDEKVKKEVSLLCSENIQEFITRHWNPDPHNEAPHPIE
jgi:acetyltransferase-like isoleucine patch superfamily enzyme